jgi:chromosome segregation ATPase
MEKVLSALKQIEYLLGQQQELRDALAALSTQLPPVLKASAEELANLTAKISEAQQQLGELEVKIANSKLRHDQLEASEAVLNGKLRDIHGQVDQALEGFRLHRAQA